jgi:hypothetical protein
MQVVNKSIHPTHIPFIVTPLKSWQTLDNVEQLIYDSGQFPTQYLYN